MHRKHYTLQSFLRSEILYNPPATIPKDEVVQKTDKYQDTLSHILVYF